MECAKKDSSGPIELIKTSRDPRNVHFHYRPTSIVNVKRAYQKDTI